jgi:hypothetical protein
MHDKWVELTPRANLRRFPDMARGILNLFICSLSNIISLFINFVVICFLLNRISYVVLLQRIFTFGWSPQAAQCMCTCWI